MDPRPPTSIASPVVTDESSQGVRAAVAAYTIWGLLTIYWKELAGFDAFELIGWRIACAGVVMAIVVTVRGRWPALRRGGPRPATAGAGRRSPPCC